jgi:hypothetical protein
LRTRQVHFCQIVHMTGFITLYTPPISHLDMAHHFSHPVTTEYFVSVYVAAGMEPAPLPTTLHIDEVLGAHLVDLRPLFRRSKKHACPRQNQKEQKCRIQSCCYLRPPQRMFRHKSDLCFTFNGRRYKKPGLVPTGGSFGRRGREDVARYR